MAKRKIPYIMVHWHDSVVGPGWKTRFDAEHWAHSDGSEHISIGFELPIGDDDFLVLAQSLQWKVEGNVGDLLQIPRSCIIKTKKLGSVEDPQ